MVCFPHQVLAETVDVEHAERIRLSALGVQGQAQSGLQTPGDVPVEKTGVIARRLISKLDEEFDHADMKRSLRMLHLFPEKSTDLRSFAFQRLFESGTQLGWFLRGRS